MHHQDFSGDPTGSRKTSFHYRRGSSGASASSSAGSGVHSSDDNPTQAGSSSPVPHHQQPLSQMAGAQVKKKSGFQITSVTSAQINVSGNNSLADDTESYDDLDESHTEDLSSDMLDVSVPRTMDTGVPERSSSDETLNSLHGVETPGLVSPNEPLQSHSVPHALYPHTSMVNGSVHHHYYPQQHSYHHSDSLGGGEPSLSAPVGIPSPAMVSKAGPSQPHKPLLLENTKPPVGTNAASVSIVGGAAHDPHQAGCVNTSNMAAVIPSPAADMNGVAGGVVGPSAAAASSSQTHHTQTQTATASRFRVVKLDTNSEPFRKGRWTCTEYYEKEIPQPTTADAPKGADGEAETGSGVAAVQPPHSLQPYQPPSQDFTSPQAIQSPPQGPQATPLSYGSPQELVGGAPMQKPGVPLAFFPAAPQTVIGPPPPVIPHQLPGVVDAHQAEGSYSTAPQLHAGLMAAGGVRQPDFIQPTAPFQTQVQSLQPHVTSGPPVSPVPAITTVTQHLPKLRQPPPAQPAFPGQAPTIPAQIQPPPQVPAPGVPPHGTPSVPLTAVLQPLLTPGAFPHVPSALTSSKSSQLEDAQKLLFQHQGLLGLPRLAGGQGALEAGSSVGTLAHMGMSAEASAFMAAAAAGFRAQHEGGEDR